MHNVLLVWIIIHFKFITLNPIKPNNGHITKINLAIKPIKLNQKLRTIIPEEIIEGF